MANRFITLDELNDMPAPQWLIENLFERNALVMLAGPSYSFKSFLLLDWLLCMATGRNWQGKATLPCKVGYALGEGKASLIKRIHAWVHYNQLTPEEDARLKENFRVTFEVPQLASKASVDNMLNDLQAEDFTPSVIAIDTFARSFVGLDENDAKDTGLWIEQADRLRQLGYGVIFLHHTKKNTEFGVSYRGSTAIMGAMDTAMTLVREQGSPICTLTVTKQKDHDEGSPLRFRRVLVPISKDESSCVLIHQAIIDERFSAEYQEAYKGIAEIIDELIEDADYKNDTARALELMKRVPDLSISAAKMRISRRTKELGGVPDESLDQAS